MSSGRGVRLMLFLGAVFAVTLTTLIFANGDPVIGFAPLLAVVALYGICKLPLRTTVLGLLFLLLIADYIAEQPHDGMWESPLNPLGRLLFVNVNHLTGVSFLRAPPLDFLLLFLCGVIVVRKAYDMKVDPPSGPSARVLHHALSVSFFTIVAVEVWGTVRGGNFKESLWQFHQMGFIPIITFVYLSALRGPQDHWALGRIVVITACIKSFIGAYFIYAIARPRGLWPEFATSHSDSFLYVTALMIWVCLYAENPIPKNLWRGLLFVPIVSMGLVLNDRRLAYVSMGACVIAVYLMSPWTPFKRRFTKRIILSLPLIALYIGAGWSQEGTLFLPVQTFKSVIYGEEHHEGPDYRDMEDFNLLATWNKNPVLGSGFGHKFEEPVKMPDISFAMPNYQYQPHNTVLWMWGVAGLFGYTGIFMYLVVIVYLAARSHRMAQSPTDRTVALVAVTVVIQYMNQCYGDMGTNSWIGAFFIGITGAVVGRLAVRVGAWPAPAKQRSFDSVIAAKPLLVKVQG